MLVYQKGMSHFKRTPKAAAATRCPCGSPQESWKLEALQPNLAGHPKSANFTGHPWNTLGTSENWGSVNRCE